MEIQCKGKKAPEIYGVVKSKLTHYRDTGKLQIKEVSFDDTRLAGVASGTGFKAKVAAQDEKLLVELELNFLLKPMRGQIETQLRETLAKALA